MAEPLKDPVFFARVFIEKGALTWPSGYDWDPLALHDEMKAAGLLGRADAASSKAYLTARSQDGRLRTALA